MKKAAMKLNFKTIVSYYNLAAVMIINILLFFLLINILFFLGFKIKDSLFKQENVVSEKYGQSLLKVYPGWNEKEINQLLDETWTRNYIYKPFVQFGESPYQGKYVNVDESGFRLSKNQGPWPLAKENFNVFIFGGSTAFGYGVPDEETIASYLQDYLSGINLLGKRVAVYNFGQGNYFSTQERILFEQLLNSGNIPNLAIFIDGLNEFYYNEDKPIFTELFEQITGNRPRALKYLSLRAMESLPIAKAANLISNKIFKNDKLNLDEGIYNDSALINRVIDRYFKNKKLIEATASVYKIKPVFVWQPIPLYKYDLKYHLFVEGGFERHTYSKYGYPQMAKLNESGSLGNDFLWCADMQEGIEEPLYVDKVHYTAEMSQKLAQKIADLLVEKIF